MAKYYKVIKRDKTVTSLDITKISQVINWANDGLDLNPLELESSLTLRFKNMMTTEEIHENQIHTALTLTSPEEPRWSIVASRLKLMDLYKKVSRNRKYTNFGYGNFLTFVKESIKKGLYTTDITKYYTNKEIKTLAGEICINYDMDFDYAGTNLLISRYLIRDADDLWELPQEMFMVVAMLIERFQPNAIRMSRVINTYHKLAKREISLASPLLMNLRKPFGNLSSCFILTMPDSRNGIYYALDQIGEISKNAGGVGVNVSFIRAKGSWIKDVSNASGGVIPWIKLINDTVVAVNQQGKRAGAATISIDVWHADIEDFLELQTENGDQRKKAYDIFPQIIVPDEFMRRVDDAISSWMMFDPYEIKKIYNVDIPELWGTEFEKLYDKIENDVYTFGDKHNVDLRKLDDQQFEDTYRALYDTHGVKFKDIKIIKKVKARELFKNIMKTQIETGMPYLTFKDAINRANPNKHKGYIPGGNLCQESFSNVRQSNVGEYYKKDDGSWSRDINNGEVHTCNLTSINLANVLTDEQLKEACITSVRVLDNAIDFTDVPIGEGTDHNNKYRTIGVGAMGLADHLAYKSIGYINSKEYIGMLFEKMAIYSIEASIEIAKDKGAYPEFKGSDWDKSIIFGRPSSWYETESNYPDMWKNIFVNLKKYGIRNSQILAIAPNTSSSLVQGCSASVLPIFSKFYMDKNSKGIVPIAPQYLKDKFWYYQEFKNIDQKVIVDIISEIQKWVDTGISMELLFNLNSENVTAKYMYDTLLLAWKKGTKTIYYIRSIQKNTSDVSEKNECVSCSG